MSSRLRQRSEKKKHFHPEGHGKVRSSLDSADRAVFVNDWRGEGVIFKTEDGLVGTMRADPARRPTLFRPTEYSADEYLDIQRDRADESYPFDLERARGARESDSRVGDSKDPISEAKKAEKPMIDKSKKTEEISKGSLNPAKAPPEATKDAQRGSAQSATTRSQGRNSSGPTRNEVRPKSRAFPEPTPNPRGNFSPTPDGSRSREEEGESGGNANSRPLKPEPGRSHRSPANVRPATGQNSRPGSRNYSDTKPSRAAGKSQETDLRRSNAGQVQKATPDKGRGSRDAKPDPGRSSGRGR